MRVFWVAILLAFTQDAKSEWAPTEFPIGFWVAPPARLTSVELYKAMAEAGFTFAMPPFEWDGEEKDRVKGNHKILDCCKEAGIKAFIYAGGVPQNLSKPKAREHIDAAIAEFSRHPAFAGFYLKDEPGADLFAGLAQVVAYVREKDPKHACFINLYPNYASAQQMNVPTYKEYVEKFVQTVRPFCISYDHYHLHSKGDSQPSFYSNLELVRKISLESKIPFWQTVESSPFGDIRDPNEAEMRYLAMQTLVYGAKGLMWFTFWQHVKAGPSFGPAIFDKDGNKTKSFEEIKHVNADVKAIGKYLLTAASESVYASGKEGLIKVSGPGKLMIGTFRDGSTGYVLFTNREYRAAAQNEAFIDKSLQRLDKRTGQWVDAGRGKIALNLAPGDGELYRFK